MNTHVDQIQESKSQSVVNSVSKIKSSNQTSFQFVDNRYEGVAQRKFQKIADNSPQTLQLKKLQTNYNANVRQNQTSETGVIQLVLSLKDMSGGGQTTNGSYSSVQADCNALHQNRPAVSSMTLEQLKAEKKELENAISVLQISTSERLKRLVPKPKTQEDIDHYNRYTMEDTQLTFIENRLSIVDAERVKKTPPKPKPKKDKDGFITVTRKK